MMGLTKTSGSLALGLAAAVLATVVVTAAAPPPQKAAKVDVCHWSDTELVWNKLSIGQPALAAHLRNHDDAVPGGTTSTTATQLDDDCQPVAALLTCPCWSSYTQGTLAAALNAESATTPDCQSFDPGSTRILDEEDFQPTAIAENSGSFDCVLRLTTGDTGLILLTQEQANACNVELTAVIPLVEWCAPHK